MMKTIGLRITAACLAILVAVAVFLGKDVLSTGLGFSLDYSYRDALSGDSPFKTAFTWYLRIALVVAIITLILVWLKWKVTLIVALVINAALMVFSIATGIVGAPFDGGGWGGFFVIFFPLLIAVACLVILLQQRGQKELTALPGPGAATGWPPA